MASRRAFLGVLLYLLVLSAAASAEVNLNINIGTPPPAVVMPAPPPLAVVPGTYVYVATDMGANTSANMVFYQDNWYRPQGNAWFVSLSYNGPWKAVSAPPQAIMRLPQNYHVVPAGQQRLPYVQVKDNWRTWERDRHWDGDREDDDHDHDKHHKKHKKKHHDEDDDHGRGHGKGHGHDD